MDLLHPRCAGLDVSKHDVTACVRLAREGRAGATSTVTTWNSMTGQILALREHLVEQQVTLVVMEATGDYWKPFYYLPEDAPLSCCWSTPGRSSTSRAARPTSPTPNSWPSWAHGLVRGRSGGPRPK